LGACVRTCVLCSGDPSTAPYVRFLQLRFVDFSSETTLQNRFFAVSNTELVTRVHCNGHAAGVDVSDQCICEHNTTGVACDACMPLFNSKPWLSGSGVDANECVACDCGGNADMCEYNATLDVNPQSRTVGDGGVCVCVNDTAGPACAQVCSSTAHSH
jgi:hypothetical protein